MPIFNREVRNKNKYFKAQPKPKSKQDKKACLPKVWIPKNVSLPIQGRSHKEVVEGEGKCDLSVVLNMEGS